MANILRLNLTTDWVKLDDEFVPEVDSQYEVQNVGNCDILVCESSTVPTENTGNLLKPNKVGLWTKEEGLFLFVKSKDKTIINLNSL